MSLDFSKVTKHLMGFSWLPANYNPLYMAAEIAVWTALTLPFRGITSGLQEATPKKTMAFALTALSALHGFTKYFGMESYTKDTIRGTTYHTTKAFVSNTPSMLNGIFSGFLQGVKDGIRDPNTFSLSGQSKVGLASDAEMEVLRHDCEENRVCLNFFKNQEDRSFSLHILPTFFLLSSVAIAAYAYQHYTRDKADESDENLPIEGKQLSGSTS